MSQGVPAGSRIRGRSSSLLAAFLVATVALAAARGARSDSTPVGPLPAGPTSTITTSPGQLVALALPRAASSSGLVWRVARSFNSAVVREVSEADVGANVVVIYRVTGRGRTVLIYALTRGDQSAKAVKAVRQTIVSR